MCSREDDPTQHDEVIVVHDDGTTTDEVWDRARMDLHVPEPFITHKPGPDCDRFEEHTHMADGSIQYGWYPGIDDLPKDRTGCIWIIVAAIVSWAAVGGIAYVILRKAGVL